MRPEPEEEAELLGQVDSSLARALEVREWWRACERNGGFPEVFPLTRSYNPAQTAYGFFGEIPDLPLMGMVQQMPYDTTKAGAPTCTREQMREFALHYFMRLSDFSRPAAFVPSGRPPTPGWLQPVSWCSKGASEPQGFGFEQLYYRQAGRGAVCAFPNDERYHIVDLRRIGPEFDWILLRVRIYDFVLHFRPFGNERPSFEIPLRESNYLLVSPHFIEENLEPGNGAIGRFSFGYAVLRNPGPPGFLAYGPGHFRAGFQNFEFTVWEDGSITVRMAFVVDRPERIVNVPIDPFDWSVILTDLFSLGILSRVLPWLRKRLATRPGRLNDVDPVLLYIDFADALTAGYSRRQLCIDKRNLEVDFMLQHFNQHYEMMTGSLATWSQVRDWTNPDSIPDWVKKGILIQ